MYTTNCKGLTLHQLKNKKATKRKAEPGEVITKAKVTISTSLGRKAARANPKVDLVIIWDSLNCKMQLKTKTSMLSRIPKPWKSCSRLSTMNRINLTSLFPTRRKITQRNSTTNLMKQNKFFKTPKETALLITDLSMGNLSR